MLRARAKAKTKMKMSFSRELVVKEGAIVSSEPTDKPWGLREFGLRTPDGHRIVCGEML